MQNWSCAPWIRRNTKLCGGRSKYLAVGLVVLASAQGGPAWAETSAEPAPLVTVVGDRGASDSRTTPGERVIAPEQAGLKPALSLGELLRGAGNAQADDSGGVLGLPVVLRRVTSQASGTGYQPAIPLFVDGVYQGDNVGSHNVLVDMASAVIHPGPGPDEFARSSLGGAIMVQTMQPSGRGAIQGDMAVDSRGDMQWHAYSDMPEWHGIKANLSAYLREGPGRFLNRQTGRSLDNTSIRQLRAQLLADPWANGTIALGLTWFQRRDSAPLPHLVGLTPAPAGLPGLNLLALAPSSAVPIGDDFVSQDYEPRERIGSVQASMRLVQRLGSSRLEFLSSYRGYEFDRRFDGDASLLDLLRIQSPERYHAVTEQVRLAGGAEKLTWRIGAAWTRETTTNHDGAIAQPMLMSLYSRAFAIPIVPGEQAIIADTSIWRDIVNVDARLAARIAPGLTMTLWSRASHEHVRALISQRSSDISQLIFGYPRFTGFTTRAGFDDVQPGVALEWTASRTVTITASAGKGFKAGGFTQSIIRGASPQQAGIGFAPERLWSYEAGANWSPSPRLQARATVFLYDWLDRQITKNFVTQGLDASRTVNCCDLRGWGSEGQITWSPADWLVLHADGGAARLKVTKSSVSALPVGTVARDTPQWSAGGGATVTARVAGRPVELRGLVTARGRYDLVADGSVSQRPFALVSLGATLELSPGITLALLGENLTARRWLVYVDQTAAQLPFIGALKGYVGSPPRSFGFRLAVAR